MSEKSQFEDLPGFQSSFTWLIERGIPLPNDLRDRLAAVVAPTDLARLGSAEPPPALVIDAWQNALTKTASDVDPLAWILLAHFYSWVYDQHNPSSIQIAEELRRRLTPSGARMNLGGSWFEARRRFAYASFDFGRRGEPTAWKRQILKETLSTLDFLIRSDRRLAGDPKTRRICYGYRGIAHLLLARDEETPLARYEQACEDLSKSGAAGNADPEWHVHLVEAYLRRNELSRDPAYLDRAEEIISGAFARSLDTRGIHACRGEILFARGVQTAQEGRATDARSLFEDAVQYYSSAMEREAVPSHPDDYLRLLRGQARFRLFTSLFAESRVREESVLDAALEDLTWIGDGETSIAKGGSALPWALYYKADLRIRREQINEALVDLVMARKMAGEWLDSSDLAGQIRISEHICHIWQGIIAEDPPAVLSHCETLLAWPNPPARPVAAIARGGAFLLNHLPILELRDFVIRFADYVEPIISSEEEEDSARSFAASHAGRLLLLIAKQRRGHRLSSNESLTLLQRAHAFYEVALAINPSHAPELLSSAGETALRLANAYRAAGPAVLVREALVDAVRLLERVLDMGVQPQSESSGFSLVVAHSKLGETYVRLHALTLNDIHAESAITHLGKARELGNDTAYVLGLMGDVYYRRGRARRDVNDLRTAVDLKRQALDRYDPSEKVKENRSVASAAHLRLWELTGVMGELTAALETALEAAVQDPSWPWPLFQIADLINLSAEAILEAASRVTCPASAEHRLFPISLRESRFSLAYSHPY